MVFALLRQLSLSGIASAAGAGLYLFHAAVLWAYWLPSYIFEVLCCSFLLATMLLYIRGRWMLGLVTFWLAYKSKEIAIMLPVALFAWEFLCGERRWKRLIPYLLISLNFGLQAIWINHYAGINRDYVLHFTPLTLWHSIAFYSSAIFFVPFLGLALLVLPFLIRDWRLYFGLIFSAALFIPMLFLPSRQETVYWYIPLIGVAIAVGTIASRTPRWAIALFFVLWFPLNYAILREKRREILSIANDRRWYLSGLLAYAHTVPPVKSVVYDAIPPNMGQWGVVGAIHLAFGFKVDPVWYGVADKARYSLTQTPAAVVGYYPATHTVKGWLKTDPEPATYFDFHNEVPFTQLGPGWLPDGSPQVWIEPEASITVDRPPAAAVFEILGALPSSGLTPGDAVTSKVTLYEDGVFQGTVPLSQPRGERLRWKLSNAAPGARKLRIVVEPPRLNSQLGRPLGIKVEALGYVPSGR